MIVFCSFEQQFELIKLAKQYGLNNYINLVFRKSYSSQVLKANMRIVGNCEYAVLFYREKLPKFNNEGRMIFNCLEWKKDEKTPKVHPTQKPIELIKSLIEKHSNINEVVLDCFSGSGTTALATYLSNRNFVGCEINEEYYSKSVLRLKEAGVNV